ncbi:MAG: hypothetical protein CHACPFDD_03421 [Phycisphaerae bacterium]|nr:hypothetical protein [Phycisphaerae bacterium]
MRARRGRRRGLLLTQLVALLPLIALLVAVLWKVANDAMYLQRVAAQRANAATISETLVRQLRGDAWAATGYERSGDALVLDVAGRDGQRRVTYTFDGDSVRRSDQGSEQRVWRAARLSFGWSIEAGRFGDLLHVEMCVSPPARAQATSPKRFEATVVLPRGRESRAGGSP